MKKHLLVMSAFIAAAGLASAAQADNFHVTFENAGVKNSTAAFASKGIETFDALGLGSQSFSTDFDTGSIITGSYSGVQIVGANQYGGAGGTGNFASTSSTTGFALSLATSDPAGINYFGFWLSALDNGNNLTFSRAGIDVFTFSSADVLALVSTMPAYFGNPDGPFQGATGDQAYVFLNFFDTDGTFDKVSFSENPEIGGYESDNHTVGVFTRESGTPVNAVPEPASWALMIAGFGLAGAIMRRRAVMVTARYA